MKKAKILELMNGSDLVKEADDVAIDSKIWLFRKAGWSCYQIGVELGMPTTKVRKRIQHYIDAHLASIKERIQEEMQIDAERIEDFIAHYTPIAKACKVEVTRFDTKGEPYVDDEWKYSLQAGELVNKFLAEKAKLFGYSKTDVPTSIINNHAFFMASENKIVEEIIDSQPLELESVEVDGAIDLSFDP